MEKTATVKRLLKFKWAGFLLLAALAYGAHYIYEERTMPPPLVYLIPEDYFGPVFVFFGQADGVDLIPDPLGHAVKVPENGLVKLRATVSEAIPSNEGATKQVLFWVRVAKDGGRRNFMVAGPIKKNEAGEFVRFFADENSKTLIFPMKEGQSDFSFFSNEKKNERMIFDEDGCKYQRFIPEQDSDSKRLACGKFLVLSPNEIMKMPYWIWDRLDGEYTSIQELENDLNEVVLKKKEYYVSPENKPKE